MGGLFFLISKNPEKDGTMGCLLHWSPKFYNNVFLFVGLTTLGTLVNFDIYSLSRVFKRCNINLNIKKE